MKPLSLRKDIARSLIEAVFRTNEIARALSELRRVQDVFRASPATVLDLEEKSIPLSKRQAVFKDVLGSDVHPLVLQALLSLQRHSLLSGFDLFLDEVEEEARYGGHYEVDVMSVDPLSQTERDMLASLIRKQTGGTVQLREHSKPELLGGLQIRIGDRLIDVSVQGALKRLHASLVHSS